MKMRMMSPSKRREVEALEVKKMAKMKKMKMRRAKMKTVMLRWMMALTRMSSRHYRRRLLAWS